MRPDLTGLPPARRAVAHELATHHDPVLVYRLARAAYETDEVADRVVEAFEALPGRAGWELLDRALSDGLEAVPDAPAPLREMLVSVLEPPDWVDFDRVDAGAAAFWRAGTLHSFSILQVLLAGYESAAVVKPLVRSGRLEYMAVRRVEETGQWFINATAPAAMRPGGAGIRATVRIRLVHSLIRRRLKSEPDWDSDAWGEPINQAHNAGTLGGAFMLVPVRVLEDAGVRFSTDEHAAICHLFSWVGHVMGVPRDLQPSSFEWTEEMLAISQAADPGPDEDSRRLTAALLSEGMQPERALPRPLQRLARPPLHWISRRMSVGLALRSPYLLHPDELGLPQTPFKHAFPLLRPLVWAGEVPRAIGLLGPDERIARRQIATIAWLIRRLGGSVTELQPEEVEGAPGRRAA